MILSLLDLGVRAFTNWNDNRTEVKKIKQQQQREDLELNHELKKAVTQSKIKQAQDGQLQTFTLDHETIKNMGQTLKDDFILYCFYTPMVLSFCGFEQQVLKGFEAVSKMPDWYVLIVVLLAVTISGMRGIFKETIGTLISKIKGVK